MREFAEKYRDVKVQTSLKKIINAQYATAHRGTGVMNTMFMETECPLKRRSQEAREDRIFSTTRRFDLRGRGYVRTYNRSQSQGCSERF